MNDLVTIIVPVYNVEKYLDRCLESLVKQTYNNIEIIVVDDGSSDSSSKKCDEWQTKDKRITLFHQANAGLSAARNKGLDNANGNYVMFVDSDDYVDSAFVEMMVKAAKEDNDDIVICNYYKVLENGEKIINDKINYSDGSVLTIIEALLLFEDKSLGSFYNVCWNKIYRRKLFDELRFPVGKASEDAYVMPRLYLQTKRIKLISTRLYFYVMRSGSITNTKGKELDTIKSNIEILEFLETKSKEMNCKELFLKQQIHLYAGYAMLEMLTKEKRKYIQRKIRDAYFSMAYQTKVGLISRIKFFLAVCNIDLYYRISTFKN